MRLIDADAIKLPKGFFEEVDNVPKFYEWLNEQPTIEPSVEKHGMWKVCCYQNKKCSECGYIIGDDDAEEFRYCPHCGAKMERSEEGSLCGECDRMYTQDCCYCERVERSEE